MVVVRTFGFCGKFVSSSVFKYLLRSVCGNSILFSIKKLTKKITKLTEVGKWGTFVAVLPFFSQVEFRYEE